jgi:dihydroxyacetone kinase
VKTLDIGFWLHALDGAIGDGDHGTSMLGGFREAQNSLRSTLAADCGEVFRCIGRAFLESE